MSESVGGLEVRHTSGGLSSCSSCGGDTAALDDECLFSPGCPPSPLPQTVFGVLSEPAVVLQRMTRGWWRGRRIELLRDGSPRARSSFCRRSRISVQGLAVVGVFGRRRSLGLPIRWALVSLVSVASLHAVDTRLLAFLDGGRWSSITAACSRSSMLLASCNLSTSQERVSLAIAALSCAADSGCRLNATPRLSEGESRPHLIRQDLCFAAGVMSLVWRASAVSRCASEVGMVIRLGSRGETATGFSLAASERAHARFASNLPDLRYAIDESPYARLGVPSCMRDPGLGRAENGSWCSLTALVGKARRWEVVMGAGRRSEGAHMDVEEK
ncbi:hypothetical protein DFP72DRAFT_1079827 [Ephemerocybe angulata]|uniref:Uncharacterized protein n=1 Tax=Ephemerocybe angulata TaxID=980116 RepID=A0A8H6HCC6_9AGAR|nr:hypothetical protein DFP72DRAFT_1079827 [Tulosesus angulatus]